MQPAVGTKTLRYQRDAAEWNVVRTDSVIPHLTPSRLSALPALNLNLAPFPPRDAGPGPLRPTADWSEQIDSQIPDLASPRRQPHQLHYAPTPRAPNRAHAARIVDDMMP